MFGGHTSKAVETEIDAEAALSGVDFPESYLMSMAINAYSIELTILADVSGYRKIEETESILKFIRFRFLGLSDFTHSVEKMSFLQHNDRDKSVDLGSIYAFNRTPLLYVDAPVGRHRLNFEWADGQLGLVYEKCEAAELDSVIFEG